MGNVTEDLSLISELHGVISSLLENTQLNSSEDCIDSSVILESPEKQFCLKRKVSQKNKIYNKDTIDKHIKSCKVACKNIEEDSSVDLYNPFDHSECYTYMRINEILNLKKENLPRCKKVQVIGLFKEQFDEYFLVDKEYGMNVRLKFTNSSKIPANISYVVISGLLKIDNDIPIITVYIWNYCIESQVKQFDDMFYNQRLQIQQINKILWQTSSTHSTLHNESLNSTVEVDVDLFDT